MSTYTPSLGLELITPGSQAGLWGNTTNNTFNLIDQAITGVTPINFATASGTTYTLTDFNGAADESRAAVLNITGAATGSNTVVIPNKQKTYLVRNSTGQDVVFATASPSATYTVGAGYSILIFCDGNNNVFTGIASPSVGTLSVNAGGTGATTFGAGGFIKSTGGTNALTVASQVNAASELTGAVPVTNGGTGQTSLTSGALLVGNGTGNVAVLSGGVIGYVPTWNGSTWISSAPASAGVSSLTGGTGITVSGATGAVTVSNSGVTQLTAGSGISLSSSTGSVTISSTGGGVSSFNTRTGAVTLNSSDVTTALGYTPPSTTGTGASGTWNISINGSAASATSATNATNVSGTIGASTTLQSQTITPYAGFKNKIINGQLYVNQRYGYDLTTYSTSGYNYGPDRWFVTASGASVTGQSGSTNGIGFFRLTGASGASTVGIGTRLEAVDVAYLAGSTVTLSLTLAASNATSGTYTVSYANTADSFGTKSSPTVTTIATGVISGITTTQTRKSVQIAIPNEAVTGLQILFTVPSLGAGQTVTFQDVQLEQGTVMTPIERPNVEQVVLLCSRYYQLFLVTATTYGQNSHQPTPLMRTAPTLNYTIQLGTGGVFNIIAADKAYTGFWQSASNSQLSQATITLDAEL